MYKEVIYISDENKEIWDKIKELAKKDKRGIGFYICEKFEKMINKKEIF